MLNPAEGVAAATVRLEEVEGMLTASPVDGAAIAAAIAALDAALGPGGSQVLPPEIETNRSRAIAVEVHKQMRLLALDALFLRAAKQPQTVRDRVRQMGDRLAPLRQYLQWLAELGPAAE